MFLKGIMGPQPSHPHRPNSLAMSWAFFLQFVLRPWCVTTGPKQGQQIKIWDFYNSKSEQTCFLHKLITSSSCDWKEKLTHAHSGPEETWSWGLTLMSVSTPECMLASGLPQYKYLLESLYWHPDCSQLLSPNSRPETSPAHGLPSPSLSFPYNSAISALSSLGSFSLGSLSLGSLSLVRLFPTSLPLFSWPSPVCWPCLAYCFLSLFWTLPYTSGCTLSAYLQWKPSA